MKGITFLTFSAFIFFLELNAQVNEYAFEQKNLSYNEIIGGKVLWSGTFDNEVSGAITIPSFIFDGVVYTSVYITVKGFITFGIAPTATKA
jgi:trimeric autotransporter adhesin